MSETQAQDAQIEVAVQVELAGGGTVAAAGEVEARVTVPRLDDKVVGGKVELVQLAAQTTTRSELTGDVVLDVFWPTETTSGSLLRTVLAEVPVWEGEPAAGTTVVRVPVPADAAASAEGLVRYAMVATIDRRRGFDPSATAPLTVAGTPGVPARAELPLETDFDDDCTIAFDGVTRTVRPGEAVAGTLALTPLKDPKGAADVEVALVRRLRFRGQIEPVDDVVAREVLASGVELPRGVETRLPLSITVPADAPAALETASVEVHWVLRATVDRKGFWRHDWEAEIELNVVSES